MLVEKVGDIMSVFSFVLNHWGDILVIMICFVILGKIIIKLQSDPIVKKKAYIERLLENLIPSTLAIMTTAEIKFGKGAGRLKRSYVIDELYQRVPDEYKKYITVDNLDSIINLVLEEAEDLWSKSNFIDVSRLHGFRKPNSRNHF